MRKVILFAFAFSAFGAPLPPEQPLAPPSRVAAAFQQVRADIASNGRDFLAVWRDSRRSTQPQDYYAPEDLRAAHLDRDGRPVEAAGFVIVPGRTEEAFVAPAGDDYLVAYYQAGLFLVRVGRDGTVSLPVSLGVSYPIAFATDGNTYCLLVMNTSNDEFSALMLDRNGALISKVVLPKKERYHAVIAAGGGYLLSGIRYHCDGVHACTVDVVATKIAPDFRIATAVIDGSLEAEVRTALAANGDRALLAFLWENQSGRRVDYALLDAAAFGPMTPVRRAVHLTAIASIGSNVPFVAADGNGFLIGWREDRTSDLTMREAAIRVAGDGSPRDQVPFGLNDFTALMYPWFASARNDSRTIVVNSEAFAPPAMPDVVGRVVASFDSIKGAERVSLTYSAPAQLEPALAVSGNRAIAVWREGDSTSAIVASLFTPGSADQRVVEITPRTGEEKTFPDVAALGDVFLVTWEEKGGQGGRRIFARRIGVDGTLLDAQPLQLDVVDAWVPPVKRSTSIAADGTQFFVVWSAGGQEVHGARVLKDGTLLDQTPIVVSHDVAAAFHIRVSPRAIWTGTQFLVVWSDDRINRVEQIHYWPSPLAKVRSARVTGSGAVLDAAESTTLSSIAGTNDQLSIARGNGRLMLVWTVQPCLMALELDLDGRPLASAPETLTCATGANIAGSNVVWDGGAFTVFWSDLKRLRAIRLVSPRVSIDVAENTWSPDAVTLPGGGAILAYSRLAAEEAYGDVPRVFTRLYQVPVSRRQAVRH
jgi:hypothetical protein